MSSEDLITAVEHILERLKRGPATETDLETLRRALQAKQIAVVTGQRAANFGGSVTGAVVVTGDYNNVLAVFNETDKYALPVLEKLTPRPAWPLVAAGLLGIAAIAVVAFLVLVQLGLVEIPRRAVVAHETALRSLPDHQSAAVARLSPGQPVRVLGQISETLWVHVETTEGNQGWVSKGDLENPPKDIPPAADPATATATPAPTHTATPTPSVTPTATPMPTPTLTPTPLPPPEAAKVYYLIILDASSRMTAGFEGGDTKWASARKSAMDLLTGGLPSRANYGLIVLGGSQTGGTQTCDAANQMLVPLGLEQRNTVIERIKPLEPKGIASLTNAIALARDELLNLPAGLEKTIVVITGGGDSCRPGEEWGALLNLLKLSFNSINAYTELIILADEQVDEEVLAAVQDITRLGLENVRAGVPSNEEELVNTIENVADNAVERARLVEPAAIAAEETAVAATVVAVVPTSTQPSVPTEDTPQPPQVDPTVPPTATAAAPLTSTPTAVPLPTQTSTPTPTATPTATQTPVPPTYTSTSTATATPIPTIPPTPTPSVTLTPTPPPGIFRPLPPQNQVYLENCPLIAQTSGFNEFESNQATISSSLVSEGHTGQGLRLDFSVLGDLYSYSVWEVLLGDPGSSVDLTSYASLKFYIRGAQGGETPNVWLMTPVEGGGFRRYYRDVEAYKTLTTQWQEIVIPLADFTIGDLPSEQIDLRHINKIQVVFEWYEETTSGTIYIDDLCVGP